MKVLHLNLSDTKTGAAKAAYRLHRALLNTGVDSKMLVAEKNGGDPTVVGPDTKLRKALAKIAYVLDSLPVYLRKKNPLSQFSVSRVTYKWMLKKVEEINPDIVHFHFVTRGMIGVSDIPVLKRPVCWSLHDMLPFTGGCHYDNHCLKFQTNCHRCPVLQSKRKSDLSSRIFKRKRRSYKKLQALTPIGLSSWMAEMAQSSPVFEGRKVVNLPNPIDTTVFAPYDQQGCRELLGLPPDKKLILFGAFGGTRDPRKGFQYFTEALKALENEPLGIVVIGREFQMDIKSPAHAFFHLGYLHDEVSLRMVYNAVDVTVLPSLQENFSNTILESMSCGTPVVGFNIGGNKDMISHQENGYLAAAKDSNDLSKGISWALADEQQNLGNCARAQVVNNFDSKVVAMQYLTLYEQLK